MHSTTGFQAVFESSMFRLSSLGPQLLLSTDNSLYVSFALQIASFVPPQVLLDGSFFILFLYFVHCASSV